MHIYIYTQIKKKKLENLKTLAPRRRRSLVPRRRERRERKREERKRETERERLDEVSRNTNDTSLGHGLTPTGW